MRNLMTKCLVAAAAVAVGFVFSGGSTVEARPQYMSAFKKAYPDVTKNNKVNCTLCHPTKLPSGVEKKKAKTIRNNYGAAFGKALFGKDIKGKKNDRDKTKISKAIKAAEKGKSATDGKTFGDLLKDKKLPGMNEAAKKEEKKKK